MLAPRHRAGRIRPEQHLAARDHSAGESSLLSRPSSPASGSSLRRSMSTQHARIAKAPLAAMAIAASTTGVTPDEGIHPRRVAPIPAAAPATLAMATIDATERHALRRVREVGAATPPVTSDRHSRSPCHCTPISRRWRGAERMRREKGRVDAAPPIAADVEASAAVDPETEPEAMPATDADSAMEDVVRASRDSSGGGWIVVLVMRIPSVGSPSRVCLNEAFLCVLSSSPMRTTGLMQKSRVPVLGN